MGVKVILYIMSIYTANCESAKSLLWFAIKNEASIVTREQEFHYIHSSHVDIWE